MNLTERKLNHRSNFIVAVAAIAVVFCSNVFGMLSDRQIRSFSQNNAESEKLKFRQKSEQTEGIEIKIIRVKPKLNGENKVVGIESLEEVLQEVFVPFDKEKPDEVLAKTLTRKLPKNDYFIFQVTNKSAKQIVINANWIDDKANCLYRNKNSDYLESEKFKWLKFQTESKDQEVNFVVLAAKKMKQLDNVFATVNYLAGIPTGRGEVNLKAIDAELKQGSAKGKDEYANSKGEKITITLGNVYGKESLRSAEFYESLLNISGCSFTKEKTPKVRPEELQIGWLNNKALANYQTGNFEESKADYLEALDILDGLEIYQFPEKKLVETIILSNMGLVYATLNDHQTAISNYEDALNIIESGYLNNSSSGKSLEKFRRLSAVYNGFGTSYESLGDIEKANDYYLKALTAEREIGDKAGEGITLNSIARLMAKRGNLRGAELMYQEAIRLSVETKNQAGIGSASNNLGSLLLRQNKFDEARQAFLNANLIFKNLKNRTAQATALSNLMFVEQKANKLQTAIIYGKQSVNILQSVRKDISNIEVQLQKSFLLSRQETYRNLADLLIAENRFAEAQMIMEMLKDEEYSQLTRTGENGDTIPYSNSEDALVKNIENLAVLLNRRNELAKIEELTADEDKEFSEIDKKIAEANAEFDKSLESLKKSEPTTDDKIKKIKDQTNITDTLAKMKDETGENAVAIYTVIGTEDSKNDKGETTGKTAKFGWMVLVTEKTSKAYPIDVKNLESTVFQFRTALSSEKYDPQPIAEILYKKLFQQTSEKQKVTLETDLKQIFGNDKAPTIMWSLDGVLRYVPMAALYDGKQYLAEKYRQIVFTDQSLLGLSNKDTTWQILGLGVSQAKSVEKQEFSALPGVETELNKIICQQDESDCLIKGVRKLNNDFTKEEAIKLWTRNDGKYPVIHISSHFSFNPTNQKESFLLVNDGALKFADIENNKGLFNKVDLITLSACDTAMSNNGLESESFAWLVQQLGAKTVLASLWQVSDLGTPELMIRFYKNRAENPTMPKGEAFRQAQLSLLREDSEKPVIKKTVKKAKDGRGVETFFVGEDKIDLPFYENTGKPKFAHPYYWSSFVLIGNWK